MTEPYFPSDDLLAQRNSSNKSRAKQAGRWADVVFDELRSKFRDRRRSEDGCLCCYLCGKVVLGDDCWHLEHLDPLVLGGTHTIENLEVACPSCNHWKGGESLESRLGSEVARQVRAAVGAYNFTNLRSESVEALWAYSPRLAIRLARRRRAIPVGAKFRWGKSHDPDFASTKEYEIATTLARQTSNPWSAMSTSQLAAATSSSEGAMAKNWERAMGLHVPPPSEDQRNIDLGFASSSLILPTRLGVGNDSLNREMAFRLRFRVRRQDLPLALEQRDMERNAGLLDSDEASIESAGPES